MIARTWHGKVPINKKENYLSYLKRTGLRDYRNVAGNLGVQVLTKDELEVTHFFLITYWNSFDSIKKFAGEQFEIARYYAEDADYLLELEPFADHFEVVNIADDNHRFDVTEHFRKDVGHHLGNASWTK